MSRLFTVRDGFTATNDTLPDRFFEPKRNGVLVDRCLDRNKMEKAKYYYYTLMGWDSQGVPLPEKIEELELS
jgi:aldehyde:ferredoxin oxidoreductase